MQKITPFLWFNANAEEAVNFYTSVFKNSKVVSVSRYGEGSPGTKGTFMTGTIQLEGQDFMVLNGGPAFSFTPAVSFFVDCKTQEEGDYLWSRRMEGGKPEQCGWLKDKFGVSWQIVPSVLGELLGDADVAKSQRVMEAMLKMVKLDIAGLKRAYENG